MAASAKEAHKWSQAQTRRLIRFRADNEHKFLRSRASAKEQWETLIKELELKGRVSSQQASKKWENLKKKYKELRTPKMGLGGPDDGELTATTWQYYEDMHEVLGPMDPPFLVDTCAGEDAISIASNGGEPSSCSEPSASDAFAPTVLFPPPSPSPPPKRRKVNPIMDYLLQESEKEQKRHEETQRQTERFLTLFERLLEKL